MKHLICINLRGNIHEACVEQLITQNGYELLGYGQPEDDGIDGFYYSIRSPVVVDVYSNTTCINILICNDGAKRNDVLLYDAVINEEQLPELIELIREYEHIPYCHLVADYRIQPNYTKCCVSCINTNCEHRQYSFRYDNIPHIIKKSYMEYKDLVMQDINNYIYSTYRDMDMIVFLRQKFEKNDYMLQLFLANYYNDISEMSRFISCNTELINEYYNSRIISIKEIVSRVFLNKKGGDKLNDK